VTSSLILAHAYGPEAVAFLIIDAGTFLIPGALALAYVLLRDKLARVVYVVALGALVLAHVRVLTAGAWRWGLLMWGWSEVFTLDGHVDSTLALICAVPPMATLFVVLAPLCRRMVRRARPSAKHTVLPSER
jgi:hypothetical protein